MKKYKVGYTTGVFDLFHIGHLNILQKSKEMCEFLIVGVSTDELVRQYKHKEPLIKFEERLAIVSAIKYVDKVVSQESMNKMLAWEQLHFNVIFHGDDWKNSNLYDDYVKEFSKVGVELVFFEYTKGTSSSILANTLNKLNL